MNNHEMIGMLNVDSVGTRGDYQYPTIGVCTKNDRTGTSYTNLRLTAFVQMLIREYAQYEAELEPAGGYYDECASDNFPWYYNGYPSALITENPTQIERFHEDPESDTSSRVYGGPLTEYAKVVLAFAIELGELYEIPEEQSTTPTESFEGSMAKKMRPTLTVVTLIFIEICMLY
ncbi:unnamed protein product [Orchesella dallaii]|uniref:Peptidase M28 domain-containing protein n=1 Tax=Orchesella dallaii TaxID=48710 RepID=A0ABP1RXQ4_9HEXA